MKNIFLLGLVSLFTDISSEMVYPLIGVYLTLLGTPYVLVGLIEGIAESVANVLKVFSGTISDKYKKRKLFVVLGYTGSAAGKFLLFLSSTWPLVLFARIVDRFGKGIRTAPRDALIAESTEGEKKGRMFGFHRAMDSFGAVCGILIVYFFIQGFKQDIGMYKKIFLYATIPAILGVIILFFVRESGKKIEPQNNEKKVNLKFYDFKYVPKKAKLYILISTIFAIGNSSNQFLLLKSKSIGFSASEVILLYLLYNITYTVFSYPAGIIGDKIGKKKILISGYFIYSLVYLFFGLVVFYFIPKEFMPKLDERKFILNITLPSDTILEKTNEIVSKVENYLVSMKDVKDVLVNIGSAGEEKTTQIETLGPNQARIIVQLSSTGRSTDKVVAVVADYMRKELPANMETEFITQQGMFGAGVGSGSGLVLEVKGRDLEKLKEYADELAKFMKKIKEIYGIKIVPQEPTPELRLEIYRDRASLYGLSVQDISATILSGIKGYLATKLKKDEDEFDIRVRLSAKDRADLSQVG
ncbi:MAG: MFS transporter, partial [Endomicrobiia bacterium]